MSWHHDSCCTTIVPAPFITSLEPASGRCRFSSKWIVHIIIFKRVKIFAKNLVLEVEILSEQFGQFVSGQLVNYQDLTPGCRAAVVPTLATATTSVMEPGATTPQHYSMGRRRLRDWQLSMLSLSVFMTMCWCGDMKWWCWQNAADATFVTSLRGWMRIRTIWWQLTISVACMHVSQKMCL